MPSVAAAKPIIRGAFGRILQKTSLAQTGRKSGGKKLSVGGLSSRHRINVVGKKSVPLFGQGVPRLKLDIFRKTSIGQTRIGKAQPAIQLGKVKQTQKPTSKPAPAPIPKKATTRHKTKAGTTLHQPTSTGGEKVRAKRGVVAKTFGSDTALGRDVARGKAAVKTVVSGGRALLGGGKQVRRVKVKKVGEAPKGAKVVTATPAPSGLSPTALRNIGIAGGAGLVGLGLLAGSRRDPERRRLKRVGESLQEQGIGLDVRRALIGSAIGVPLSLGGFLTVDEIRRRRREADRKKPVKAAKKPTKAAKIKVPESLTLAALIAGGIALKKRRAKTAESDAVMSSDVPTEPLVSKVKKAKKKRNKRRKSKTKE
jgi:hypothetical protein